MLPPYLRAHPDGVYLQLKLQPRATENAIGEALGSELKIRVTAPPVDAAANEALLRFSLISSAVPVARFNWSAAIRLGTNSFSCSG